MIFSVVKNNRLKLYLAIAITAFLFIGVMGGYRRMHVATSTANKPQPIFCGDETIPEVALTCNVVWGTEYVEPILNIAKDNEVPITFFIGGEWGKEYPQLLQRMKNEGHELGNHGYSHLHSNRLSIQENQEQIRKTEEIIFEATNIRTKLFAPPYGEWNDNVVQAADMLGYQTIMWSVDTIDWKRPGSDVIRDRVLTKSHNGAIILMHPVDQTVQALPKIIQGLKEKGFTFVAVSKIIESKIKR